MKLIYYSACVLNNKLLYVCICNCSVLDVLHSYNSNLGKHVSKIAKKLMTVYKYIHFECA